MRIIIPKSISGCKLHILSRIYQSRAIRLLCIAAIVIGTGVALGLGWFRLLGGVFIGLLGLIAVYWLWKSRNVILEWFGRLRLSELLSSLAWGMVLAAPFGPVLGLPPFRSLFLFRIFFILLAGVALVYFFTRPIRWRLDSVIALRLLLIWLAWLMITLLWSVDLQAALRYMIFFFMMFVLTVTVVLIARDQRGLRRLVASQAVVYLIVLAIAIFEAFTDYHLPTSGLYESSIRTEGFVSSVFRNPNDFATYISLCFPLWLGIFFFFSNPFLIGVSATVVGSSLFVLMRTQSTLNSLAVALGSGALLLVASLRRFSDGSSLNRRFVFSLVLLGLVLFLVGTSFPYQAQRVLPYLNNYVEEGILSSFLDLRRKIVQITTSTGSGGARMDLIKEGWVVLQRYHLMGVGPGNAEFHMRLSLETARLQNLHNWWMEVLVNGGIPAFLLYCSLYIWILYNLFRVALVSSEKLLTYLSISLLASLIAFSVGCAGPSSVIHFKPMWIHFGLAISVINVHRCEKSILFSCEGALTRESRV